jgi:bacillithiol biosynthesis cysteine-adding enzyme BshC
VTRNLFEAYLAGEARAFFAHDVRESRDRQRALRAAARPMSARVLAALRAQNARLGPSVARAQQLDALADGARVVVTGQQVGLFLGPLFTIYKAATAIRLARTLQAESGTPVVPVFWLQTEDHDLPEIARAVLPRADEEPLVLTPEIAQDNRVAIAHLTLPAAISGCLETLEQEFGYLPHAPEHLARIARHYQPGHGWAVAFAGLLADLFEPEGLLMLDPRDPVLAAESAWVHRAALERSDELEHALSDQTRKLAAAGYATTVHVRASSPLSFFHPQGATGPRTRLIKHGGDFLELGSHQRQRLPDLLRVLQDDPLSFSSSALLRPIVQDALLPTAAYVGGPAELAYFAQLPQLYAAFGREPPLVAPRARMRLIEPSAARRLTRLGLSAAALNQSEHQLLRELAARNPTSLPSAAEFARTLKDGFERTLSAALFDLPDDLECELARQVAKTRGKVQMSAGKLAQRYEAVMLRRDQQRMRDLRRLKELLQPHDAPQERVFGLAYFAARYGERSVIERITAAIEPCAPASITELYL